MPERLTAEQEAAIRVWAAGHPSSHSTVLLGDLLRMEEGK